MKPPEIAVATDLDLAMMRAALALARQAADLGEAPVGAVVYLGERVLGQAHNLRESAADPTAHAEVLALRQAAAALGDWRLEGCAMAVTLEPCAMCAGALIHSRVPRVLYGALDPKAGCVDSLYRLLADTRFNHRPAVLGGVLAEESAELLRRFFRGRRAGSVGPQP